MTMDLDTAKLVLTRLKVFTKEPLMTNLNENEKSPEQMKAFGRLLNSAMSRRGWINGKVLTQEEIDKEYDTFRGVSHDQ